MQHTLLSLSVGDCLPFLEALDSESFDALVTDPPYSSGGLHLSAKQGSARRKYQQSGVQKTYPEFLGDHRDQRSHLRWMVLWLSEAFRVLKPGAPVCLFSDWRQMPLTTDALQGVGFTWRGVAVWDKTEGIRPQLGRFRAQAEFIVWGSKGDMPAPEGARVLPGVFRHSNKHSEKLHVTGKPISLMRDVVRICRPGGRIVEPFAGSGSTLVAAELEGYEWAANEGVPTIAEIASRRLQEARHASNTGCQGG